MITRSVDTIVSGIVLVALGSCGMPGARVVTLAQMLERCPDRNLARAAPISPGVTPSAGGDADLVPDKVEAPIEHKGSNDSSWSVHGMLDDKIALDFELDTGSEVTNVPDSVLQLAVCQGYLTEAEIASATPTTMTNADWSSSEAEYFTVHNLRIGDYVMHDMEVIHSSSPALLGADFFMKFSDVNIDFGHGRLRLTSEKPRLVGQ
jgi:hypothetical protein